MRKFSFASVNMRRRNAAMHTLLNTNESDDVLFIQEPWFSRVGTARCDTEIQGKDVFGGAANPKWDLAYPFFSSDQRAKVMTYTRIHDRDHPFRKNYCRRLVRNDMIAHPSILVTDILVDQLTWRTINFYNDVDNPSALKGLMEMDLDSMIPTLLVGDFNLHSHTWSPLDWMPSHAADQVEEWLATQTFTLLSLPGVPTHRGENGARDSTIDLVWCNLAATLQGTFHGAHVDWSGSMGSEHALIRTYATTPLRLRRHREDRTNRFNMDIDAEAWEEWNRIFAAEVPPKHTRAITTQDVDTLVDLIYAAFNTACIATMKKKGYVG